MAITEDYVSFETAKLLKKKGFDEKCNSYFISNNEIALIANKRDFNNHGIYLSAPTLQMAMKWLREQNKIISTLHSCVTNKYRIIITQFNKLDIANLGNTLYSSNDYDYSSYEEAEEEAIKYCLKNLI